MRVRERERTLEYPENDLEPLDRREPLELGRLLLQLPFFPRVTTSDPSSSLSRLRSLYNLAHVVYILLILDDGKFSVSGLKLNL